MDDTKKVIRTGLVIILILAAAAGVYFLVIRKPAARPAAGPTAESTPPAATEKPEAGAALGALNLPSLELDKSDDLLRGLAQDISSHPGLAAWMKTGDIIRKFVAAVDNVANGQSPKAQVDFFPLTREFRAVRRDGKLIADPAGYDRYNQIADVFISLDDKAAARLYKALLPLFRQAYVELGYPDTDFQDTLTKAVAEILGTPVVDGRIVLERKVASYAMVDENLEGLSGAQKQLLRMGPENTQVIQAKLRALAIACGLPEYRFPKPRTYTPAK
jgi:hypothetical protein